MVKSRRVPSFLALILSSILLLTARTALAQTGGISRTITSSPPAGALQGTSVAFYDLSGAKGDDDGLVKKVVTDVNGAYTAQLPAGSYGVITEDTHGYINEIWNNVTCSTTCDTDAITAVTVTTTVVP